MTPAYINFYIIRIVSKYNDTLVTASMRLSVYVYNIYIYISCTCTSMNGWVHPQSKRKHSKSKTNSPLVGSHVDIQSHGRSTSPRESEFAAVRTPRHVTSWNP